MAESIAAGSRVFDCAGLRVEAVSDRPEDLDWLAEFFGPNFPALSAAGPATTVELVTDPPRWEAMRAQAPADPPLRECFFLDTRIQRHPEWEWAPGQAVVYDREFEVFYRKRRRPLGVTVIRRGAQSLSRLAMMRVIREAAMRHVYGAGADVIHGATLSLGGEAVVIAGPKRSGKTSLLVHALLAGQAEYVSNDRTVVRFGDDGPAVLGMPTIVKLRGSTLDMFDGLLERLKAGSYLCASTVAERRGLSKPTKAWRPERYTMNPAQLCHLLQAKWTAGGPLRAVLFPEIADEAGPMRLQPLSERAAAERLATAMFRAGFVRKTGSFLAADGRGSSVKRGAGAAAQLAARVPCFVCRMGGESYRDAAWDGIRRQLLGS